MDTFQSHRIVARDGVALHVFDRPGPGPDAPVMVLSNGLGGNVATFRHLIEAVGRTHRVVSWDYRGLYGSALTADQRDVVALGIEAHAADALEVLDARGVERAVFAGWSMGVQLDFELFRMAPERVEALIALAGGHGRALSHTVLGPAGERLLRPGLGVFRAVMTHGGGLVGRLGRSGLLLEAARGLGLVHRDVDAEVFGDLIGDYVDLDFEIYTRILGRLEDHDVEAVLPSVTAPVLVIAGDRDPMTPPWLSRRMVSRLPDAELVILRGGTHYVPVELPGEVNRHVLGFLARRLGR